MSPKILIGHGSGGKLTKNLIQKIFMPHISNLHLEAEDDSALVPIGQGNLVYTVDAFTVRPLFFPGGDIGKLAVCGTINDLVVSGAKPRYLAASFIMEEGLLLEDLEKIIKSFAQECKKTGVQIVAADTKVVEKGKGDGLFISVSGIGELNPAFDLSPKRVSEGDQIIVTGDIGDHGASIVLARDELNLHADIQSDCASLDGLINMVTKHEPKAIKLMRDATRGGVATVINELASKSQKDMMLMEKDMPIKEPVRGLCELLGMNPLYLANEGSAVLIVEPKQTDKVISLLREHPFGRHAQIIGFVCSSQGGRLFLETLSRGRRLLDALVEDQLPRIC